MGLTSRAGPAIVSALAALAVFGAGCSSSTEPGIPSAPVPTETRPVVPATTESTVLLSGTVSVEAASSFDDPGFHQLIDIGGSIPDLAIPQSASGSTITVSLWDASRPNQTCSRNHPLSGCLTIDWSDAPGRPHVPEDGVFSNRLTLATEAGSTTVHLSESGSLAAVPDQFSPG